MLSFQEIHPRTDSIFLGSFVCITFLFTFAFLGLASGLSVEKSGSALMIFGPLAVLASYLIGGWVTARLNTFVTKVTRLIEGLCVWAIASLVLIYVASALAGSAFRVALNQVGLGVMSTVGIQSVADQINNLNPRLVTDIKLADGQAVTQLKIGGTGVPAAKAAGKAIKEGADDLKNSAALRETAGALKDTTRKIGWSLFGFFLASLLASVAGVFLGAQKETVLE